MLNENGRLERATGNLKKVAIFLALIGLTMLYLGWIRYLPDHGTVVEEPVWVMRVTSILVLYASLKCFLIGRYLSGR